ncbi:MAG: MFS transporter [Pseudomonadota bacterium]|uniref:MFS transporter n=1 Tax=Burkholderiaceae TaxID=119060 RepID=UPI0014858385|nr:MFS transporter [Burkholderia sp. 4M9327F10]
MMATRSRAKLGRGIVLGYASGAIVDGAMTNVVNTFLLFYVTTVCGIPPALAGLAVSIGLIVDAIADPMIGAWSDRLRSRWGRRLPFMVAAILPLCVSFAAVFALPEWSDTTMLFVLLIALSVVVRVSMSFFNLPYLAVGAELTDDFAERSRVMAWRWAAGMIGALVGIGIGFGVFLKGPGGLARRHAYPPFALTLCALTLVASAWAIRTVWKTRHLQHHPAPIHPSMNKRIARELSELMRNRSFRILFASSALFFVAFGMTQSLALHANTFFWHLTSWQTQQVTMSLMLGALVGAPFCIPLVGRIEKRTAVLTGLCGWILIQACPVSLRLAGWLPMTGQALTLLLSAATFVSGMLMSMAAVAFNSMMADATDEHEYLFGARREGLFFAGWTLAGKAAGSIGTFLSGVLLTAIAFPIDQTRRNGFDVSVSQSTLDMLGFFYGPGSAIVAIIGTLLLVRYRLNRQRHTAIIAELRRRRPSEVTAAR